MWLGSFASNIGTWMQTVVLGSYAYKLTGSSMFVAGAGLRPARPAAAAVVVGGVIADVLDRRKLLIVLQVRAARVLLAAGWLVAGCADPSRGADLRLRAGHRHRQRPERTGRGAPCCRRSSGQEDLGAAISLNSTMINGSRVVGPGDRRHPVPRSSGAAWIFIAQRRHLHLRDPRPAGGALPRRCQEPPSRAGPAVGGRLPGGTREPDRRPHPDRARRSFRCSACRSSRSSPRWPSRISACRLRSPRLRPAVRRVRARRLRWERCRSARCWPDAVKMRLVRFGLAGLRRVDG